MRYNGKCALQCKAQIPMHLSTGVCFSGVSSSMNSSTNVLSKVSLFFFFFNSGIKSLHLVCLYALPEW